ncbi:MAG TPA: redoxin domain-containing protein [Humisphaera sp.]|nr:redoxin domain-containing protein [Humisphaera sp.]
MQTRFLLSIFTGLTLAFAGAVAGNPPATQVASPAIADVTGVIRRPLEMGESKAAVIIFIAVDCPISNGYAPEINRLCKQYESKGLLFYLAYPDGDLTPADAKKHAADYGYTCPALLDRKRELAHRLGATVTPEAVVVDRDGQVAYRGRIDDLYVALGKRRFEATTHDLRMALDAIVAGKPVPTPRTTAIGCAISDN